MTAVDPQILSPMTHAMCVPIGRLGGAFVWPSLLHKLERENADHKLCGLRGPPVRPVLCFSLRKGLHVLLSGPEGRIQSVCGLCNGALTAKFQGCLRRCLIFFARSLFCVTKLRFIKAGSSAVLLRLEGLGSRPFLSSSLRSVPLWLWNLEVSNSRQGIFFAGAHLCGLLAYSTPFKPSTTGWASYRDKPMGMLGTNTSHSKFILPDQSLR